MHNAVCYTFTMKIPTAVVALVLSVCFVFVGAFSYFPKQADAQMPAGGMVDFAWYVCNPIVGSVHITYVPYVVGSPFIMWMPWTLTYANLPPLYPTQYFKGLTLLTPVPCIISYYPFVMYGVGFPLFMSGAGLI